MRALAAALLVLAASGGAARAQEADTVHASATFADEFRDFADPGQPAEPLAGVQDQPPPVAAAPAPRHSLRSAALAQPSPPKAGKANAPVASPATEGKGEAGGTANVVRIVLVLALMAFLPALLISMTSFVRIAVVLSMIRHALGMPETPPNQVLVSLALFLTAFAMMPTFQAVNEQALQPFLAGRLDVQQAIDGASGPARAFMLRQVRDQDIKAIYDISHQPLPARAEDVDLLRLVPAFMLNELRVAFRIGFVVILPFLMIDLVVSSVLLALGMMMVPPSTISLPLKVLMFVLIDGWSLILQGVIGSIH
jgi:flagellar biosynthesis protein FliP